MQEMGEYAGATFESHTCTDDPDWVGEAVYRLGIKGDEELEG